MPWDQSVAEEFGKLYGWKTYALLSEVCDIDQVEEMRCTLLIAELDEELW